MRFGPHCKSCNTAENEPGIKRTQRSSRMDAAVLSESFYYSMATSDNAAESVATTAKVFRQRMNDKIGVASALPKLEDRVPRSLASTDLRPLIAGGKEPNG